MVKMQWPVFDLTKKPFLLIGLYDLLKRFPIHPDTLA